MIVGIAFRRHPLGVVVFFFADVELAADDWFDPDLVRGIHELDCAENVSVVGHGNGGHAEFVDAMDEVIDAAGSVEQRVVGVQVQVDELGHVSRWSLVVSQSMVAGRWQYEESCLVPRTTNDYRLTTLY